MTGKTHRIGGLEAALLCLLLSPGLSLPQQLGTVPLSMAASLLPDIDLPTSTMGKRVRPLSKLIHKLGGHRGFFHSPMFLILLWVLCYRPGMKQVWILTAITAGVLSHFLLDMLNEPGIPLFWPLSKRVRLAKIKTGGKIERFVYGFLCCLVALTAGYWLKLAVMG